MICQQKNMHPALAGDHIFFDIVSDHQTRFRIQIINFDQFFIIKKIWFAGVSVFVGRDRFKIGWIKSGPSNSGESSDCRKDRIGRDQKGEVFLFELFDQSGDLFIFWTNIWID